MVILKSKIADHLAAVTKTHDVFFNFGQHIGAGPIKAYFIEILEKDTGNLVKRIYLGPKIVENDDVEKLKSILEPTIFKYASDKLTKEQVLDNWENGYFK